MNPSLSAATPNRFGKPISELVCYTAAFSVAFWFTGANFIGDIVGVGSIGILALLFFFPILSRKSSLVVPHKELLFAFVALHVFSAFFAPNLFSANVVLKILMQVVFFVLLINVINSIETLSKMTRLLLIVTALSMAFLIYIYLVVFHSLFLGNAIESATRGGKNTLAYFLSAMFPFAYARFFHRPGVLSFLVLGIIAFADVYVFSRMSLLLMGLTILIMSLIGIRKKRYIGVVFVGLFGGILLLGMTGFTIDDYMALKTPGSPMSQNSFLNTNLEETHRGTMILDGLNGFRERPLFGHGGGSFQINQFSRHGSYTVAHNDYITMLFEFGLIGTLLFFGIVLGVLKDLWSVRHKIGRENAWLWEGFLASIVCLLIGLLFNNAYFTVIVWFMLAGGQYLALKTSLESLVETKDSLG
ncbi:MAG: O-antigen ligase family protein [Candidatus Margulisiibacteriota bacterium]